MSDLTPIEICGRRLIIYKSRTLNHSKSYPNHFIHIIQINFLKGETHMISKLNPASIEMAEAILAIQIPAYEIEAKYINSHAIPRLYDRVTDIQNCEETFYGYFLAHTLVGFISFTNEESFVDIHRLVVSPNHFHRGIATDLLLHLFQLFPHIHTYIVQTGKANTPALSLYKKHGFIATQNILLPDGTPLVKLKKSKKNE